ncbi:hypothetical protein [Variovorax guangxiensis]|uniref:hypothetical protein n=1 Tax=Variovorax guangxiensis TaxID=1775474 RepID=UPI00285A963D|nr:hypothetical protein [Variovorax guangxiensis]MDR6855299.1 hypothetical protein [Variovorax guangxiensis]
MNAGKFKAGAPSANPVGRPTREQALRRDLDGVRMDLGIEDDEFNALISAMMTGSPEAIDIAIELVHRRMYADLLRARAEPDVEEKPDDDIF